MSSTVCLTLIVKNEAHVIERCLRSAKPHIHAYAIVDTGSTDDTVKKIRDTMEGIPGEVVESEWKGMAGSRNEALDLARAQGCDYLLMIDADEVWEAPDGFVWPDLRHDSYDVRIVMGNTSWRRPQLLRADKPWHYEGAAHEFLTGGRTRGSVQGPQIRSMPDGHRRQTEGRAKYDRIAKIIEKELEEHPNDPRNVFYLAQSYRDAGHKEKALAMYQRRVELQGWEEERWWAHLEVGRLSLQLGEATEVIETALVKAHELRPWRAEPLVDLAIYFRGQGRPERALRYAAAAMSLPYPDQERLFIEQDAYTWRGPDEWAMAMHQLGFDGPAIDAWKKLLAQGPQIAPQHQRQRMQQNIAQLEANRQGRKPDITFDHPEVQAQTELSHVHVNFPPVFRWAKETLAPLRERYVRSISENSMSMSLPLASLVAAMARLKAKRVLDLGSGFSTAALLKYCEAEVVSLEESTQWQEKTQEFLRREGLPSHGVHALQQIHELEDLSFDLVSCDQGLSNRIELLPKAWDLVRAGGFVVLNDMQHAPFAKAVRDFLAQNSYRGFDVRALTMDHFGRFGWIVQKQ